MQIRYQLDQKEWLEACRERASIAPWGYYAIGGIFVALGIAQIVTSRNFTVAGGFLGAGLFLLVYMPIASRRAFRRDVRFKNCFDAEISDSGVKVTTNAITSTYTWDAFREFRETGGLFLLYQAPAVVNPFPKRVFSADDQEQFRALAKAKVPQRLPVDRRKTVRTILFAIVVVFAVVLLVQILRSTH